MTIRQFNLAVQAAPQPGADRLTTIAGQLAVHEWREFMGPTNWPGGTTAFWKMPGASDGILDFLHTGIHDPVRKKIHIIGAGYVLMGHAIYDIASETGTTINPSAWSSRSLTPNIIHGWDHVAFDPVSGRIYFGWQGGSGMWYTTAANPGTAVTITPPWTNTIDTYGMEFWPTRDRLMVYEPGYDGDRRLWEFNGSSWTMVLGTGPYFHLDSFMSYNPVLDCMYMGGGQSTANAFYQLTHNGTNYVITQKPDSAGVDCVRQKLVCGDRNGHCILFNFVTGAVTRYIEGSGWATVPTTINGNLIDAGARTAIVPLRGFSDREVFMCFRANADTPSAVYCYLYRYS